MEVGSELQGYLLLLKPLLLIILKTKTVSQTAMGTCRCLFSCRILFGTIERNTS